MKAQSPNKARQAQLWTSGLCTHTCWKWENDITASGRSMASRKLTHNQFSISELEVELKPLQEMIALFLIDLVVAVGLCKPCTRCKSGIIGQPLASAQREPTSFPYA